ncbi:hypothetical protein WA026_000344 [Henosepilachna vigintioctopunctata]|uniref:Helicase C-terminal domain-containing protein n=1 Tax=Henosepilachna vigintioctopunctata TaxID=420089 RepID=A0AAW1V4N5_9CUCU
MIVSSCKFPENKFAIIPLHSLIPTDEQLKVFNSPPPGVRKIIISTIIAETSITINDVVFVIDCGKVKIKNFNFKLNIETLESVWISKANASQRKGRVGRVKPGKCFHLMTRARYETLEPYMCPEILRSRLENVLLTAKVLQLGKIGDFFPRLMDAPDPGAIAVSLDLLKRLEALDENESLTPLGYHLAKLPMNPQIGKMLLFGAIFNCLQPILNIAIILEYKDPFIIPFRKENEAIWKKQEFGRNCKSDHLFMNKLVLKFQNLNEFKREQFCSEFFLNLQTMTHILKLKREFMQHLYEMGFVPNLNPKCIECNSNSYRLDVLRAIICAGLYPNIVYIGKLENKVALFQLLNDDQVSLHPKSVLIGKYIRNPLLVYYKLIKSTNVFIHDATPVDSLHVLFFGDNFQIGSEGEHHFITISNTLKFTSIKSTAEVIKELRDKLNKFLEYKISHPSVVDLREENEETLLLRTIVALLDKKQ